jgi:SAM-dependent methyltransferase
VAGEPRLWALADLLTPMALRVAATLRLADHIADGDTTVEALAGRTGADADALGRVVNHLVGAGVLARDGAGELSLTGGLGEELREAGAWLDIEGAIGRADLSAFHLLATVRGGEPAYPLAYGRAYWEDLAAQPRLSASFDALMRARLRTEGPQVAAAYDWGAHAHVVDVGGGDGTLLAAILAAHPAVRGTLVELAGPAAAAARTLERFAGRCEIVTGSFFDPLPAGADAYGLSGVLHDWDDERAPAILRRCAEAAGPGGRVLVIEEGPTDAAIRTEGDLRMLLYTGGRERSPGDFETLAAEAGLRVGSTRPVTAVRTLIELVRRPSA